MRQQLEQELADKTIRAPVRKTLESLREHWQGLTRFLDDPRIPMDNNASERSVRGPAIGRNNYYGSGAEWSGRLAAMLFSIFATLLHWKINERAWLTWYLKACATAAVRAEPRHGRFPVQHAPSRDPGPRGRHPRGRRNPSPALLEYPSRSAL